MPLLFAIATEIGKAARAATHTLVRNVIACSLYGEFQEDVRFPISVDSKLRPTPHYASSNMRMTVRFQASGRGRPSLRARADRYGNHVLREALAVADAGVRNSPHVPLPAKRPVACGGPFAFCCQVPPGSRRPSSWPGYPPRPVVRAGAGLGALRVAFRMSGVGADR